MNRDEIQQAFNKLNAKYLLALKKLQAAYLLLDDNSKNEKLKQDNAQLKKTILELQNQLNSKPQTVEKIVEVEKIIEVEKQVSNSNTNNFNSVAKLLVNSEFNKEDLSIQEIEQALEKFSEEEVKRKMGFWAVPLPKDNTTTDTSKRYIGKK